MTRERQFTWLRIAFGLVWAIDAVFKWQPAFLNGLPDMLSSMLDGQPNWIVSWLNFWIHLINLNPHLFAISIACAETLIAVCLIFGLFTRFMLWFSIALALVIWSVGEAFGGPYGTGSTDIGAAIMYPFVALGLLIGSTPRDSSLGSEHDTPDKKDKTIVALIVGVIILAALLVSGHLPATQSTSSMDMGPGAMAPMGMSVKTFDLTAGTPVPTVHFNINEDPASAGGGWDVHVTTTNFLFTPQNVNESPVADEGHVHLYVDNTLYVVYGNWYHLDDFSSGSHLITVALAANDHTLFAKNGQYIEATTTITQQ